MSPLLPHLRSLRARRRTHGYDSVKFQHFGHRCPSSTLPRSLSPAAPSSLYIFLFSLLRVEYFCRIVSVFIKTPRPASSQARQIVAHFPSFHLCVLSPSPDRLTTNRARCAIARLLVLRPLTFAAVLIRLSQPRLLRHRLPVVSPRPRAASPSPHLSRHRLASPPPSQSLVNVGANNHAAPTA